MDKSYESTPKREIFPPNKINKDIFGGKFTQSIPKYEQTEFYLDLVITKPRTIATKLALE